MRARILRGTSLAAALLIASAAFAADLKSGPQVGASIVNPFHPTNVTGPMAGKKHCLV